jgi:16S rRNA (adenine1518-N6/adenine1519-N6)-dimethyltransferase
MGARVAWARFCGIPRAAAVIGSRRRPLHLPHFPLVKHIPRKRFGQHFLTDRGLIDEIVRTIAPAHTDHLIEIGPGLGALTLPLLAHSGAITVIELDRDLAAHWRSRAQRPSTDQPCIQVIESDVLKVPFDQIECARAAMKNIAHDATFTSPAPPSPPTALLRIAGNLPYNISTPILFHLLPYAHLVQDQHFMLQKEVVDRMVASPSTSDYGRLSVMLQWRYAMDNFLHVPPEAFDPPPRVQSAVVRMIPHAQPERLNVALLQELVQVAFSQRRKLLRHTLGRWLEAKSFAGSFDVQRRAEEVPVQAYVQLAQALG